MKYISYIENKDDLSTSAKRTIRDLATALNELLSEKRLEEISVKDICERSLVSKSSFYNYFDDKLDLTWYLMWYFNGEVKKAFYAKRGNEALISPEEELINLINRSIDIKGEIYRKNPVGSLIHTEWSKFLAENYEQLKRNSYRTDGDDVPDEIRIQINAYAISVVVNYCVTNDVDRKQMREYIIKIMR